MDKPQNEIVLPKQDSFFSTEKLRRSARAGTHLPDPTMAPYGYDPKARLRSSVPAAGAAAAVPARPAARGRPCEFPRAGTYTIAARVQDNLDSQATAVAQATVSDGRCELKPVAHQQT